MSQLMTQEEERAEQARLDEAECEQSRKLRISVTKIENGPDRFF